MRHPTIRFKERNKTQNINYIEITALQRKEGENSTHKKKKKKK
jgi:hypothetical protein